MKKVLVIEDDAPLCWLLERILRGKYEVILMSNGLEAWSWLSDGNSCDLIISDVKMPSLDGVEFDVEDRARLTTQARAAAWEEAHRRAEELAAHAWRRLGAVTAVAEVEPTYRPMARTMTFAAAGAGGPESLDVEPGTVAVEVSLTATWSFA